MDVLIRIASIDDGDNVTTLLGRSYPALMRGAYEDTILNAALPAMTVAQPALLRSDRYYVAETVPGTLVGCGGWSEERPVSGEISAGIAHIRHFGVHPEWTRRGLGRAIYARCCEDARAVGVKTFECYSSVNGESFYAALGFERIGEIAVEMSDTVSFPGIHMAATI